MFNRGLFNRSITACLIIELFVFGCVSCSVSKSVEGNAFSSEQYKVVRVDSTSSFVSIIYLKKGGKEYPILSSEPFSKLRDKYKRGAKYTFTLIPFHYSLEQKSVIEEQRSIIVPSCVYACEEIPCNGLLVEIVQVEAQSINGGILSFIYPVNVPAN